MGSDRARHLESRVGALEELLEIHEATVLEQSGRLEESLRELERARDALEIRVRERTADLEHANEMLRRRNRELDEFTYVASHDLQEPLRKLSAYCDLLVGDLGGGLSETVQQDLHFIVDAAGRMQTMVQDLLTLSRAGRKALKSEHVRIDDCADRAVEALAAAIEETGAVIRRDPLPVLRADPTLLTQLYQNLVGNALKFSRGRPQVRLTAVPTPRGWILGVRDRGIGISAGHCEQIFAAFKRLHGRGAYPGSGIGLAICRRAVERLGGEIWVESQLGEGSHFRFTLASPDPKNEEET